MGVKFFSESLLVEVSTEDYDMEMWIDLVLDEVIGVGAQIKSMKSIGHVGMDSCFEEPYPTIYVLVPVFGTSEFGEARTEIFTPVFYHVIKNFLWVKFVTGYTYRYHPDVSVTVVVEAGD